MKINLVIISLFFLISCAEIQEGNWCKAGIEQAKKDIEKDGLVFVKYISLLSGSDRYDEELEKLLNKSNIRFRYEGISCMEFEGADEQRNCYQQKMLNEIEKKFGKGFIERISKQADQNFANRENYIFEYLDLDEEPYFPNPKGKAYSLVALLKYIHKYLKYPNGYELAKTFEENPFIDLNFTVDNEGMPSAFKIERSNFPKEKEQFKVYLETTVLKIVSKIPKWEAGKIHGKRVDTNFTIRIPLDREIQ